MVDYSPRAKKTPNRQTKSDNEWPNSPKFQEFANFLGLTPNRDAKGIDWRYDSKVAKKIEEIYAWGKLRSDSEDPLDIMLEVKRAIRDLGVPYRGKTLVDHLWGWTQLDSKAKGLADEAVRIEKEKELYGLYDQILEEGSDVEE